MPFADGPAINHDKGPVVPRGGHDHARHVLVAPWDGDVGVVALGAGDGFDRVGDNFAGLQGEAHGVGAHGYAVADADGVELPGEHGLGLDGFFDDFA